MPSFPKKQEFSAELGQETSGILFPAGKQTLIFFLKKKHLFLGLLGQEVFGSMRPGL